jgi:hypothetical protein
MAQVVECLPHKPKALGSNSSESARMREREREIERKRTKSLNLGRTTLIRS